MGVVAFTIVNLRSAPHGRHFPRYCPVVPRPRFRQNRISKYSRLSLSLSRLNPCPINPSNRALFIFALSRFVAEPLDVWKYLFAQVYIDPKALIKVDWLYGVLESAKSRQRTSALVKSALNLAKISIKDQQFVFRTFKFTVLKTSSWYSKIYSNLSLTERQMERFAVFIVKLVNW